MSEKKEKKYNAVPLREEFAALVKSVDGGVGKLPLALVLGQMEYWAGRKERGEFVAEEIGRATDDEAGTLQAGWIYKSAQQLSDEIFGMVSTRSASRGLDGLVELGVLMRRRNPRNNIDKTWHYRLDLLGLGRMLLGLGYKLERWPELPATLPGLVDVPGKVNDVEDACQSPIGRDGQSTGEHPSPIGHCGLSIGHGGPSIGHSGQAIPETTTETSGKEIPPKSPSPLARPGGLPKPFFEEEGVGGGDPVRAPAAMLHRLGGSGGGRLMAEHGPFIPADQDPDLFVDEGDEDPEFPVPLMVLLDDPGFDPDDFEIGEDVVVHPVSVPTSETWTQYPDDFEPDEQQMDVPEPGKIMEPELELSAELLITRLNELPRDEAIRFSMKHTTRIEQLSRDVLPEGGGERDTRKWIPQAPVHALFAKVCKFPGREPSCSVSRSFLKKFRDGRITTRELLIIAMNAKLLGCPRLADASAMSRWIRGLWRAKAPEETPLLAQLISTERRELAEKCLRMDPEEFTPLLLDAGAPVDRWLEEMGRCHEVCSRNPARHHLAALVEGAEQPQFESCCFLLGSSHMKDWFLKNCATERYLRKHPECFESGTDERPEFKLNPGDRSKLIGELAADHLLRSDAFGFLGDDVFGITPDEIEEELRRQKEELRPLLDLYSGDLVRPEDGTSGTDEVDEDELEVAMAESAS